MGTANIEPRLREPFTSLLKCVISILPFDSAGRSGLDILTRRLLSELIDDQKISLIIGRIGDQKRNEMNGTMNNISLERRLSVVLGASDLFCVNEEKKLIF